jgi:HAD superfamily hydrolase (TIGR01490 family)
MTSTRNLALFDLDHTLIPIDSDYEWGQFLCRVGALDAATFAERNAAFYAQYQAGTLDPHEYLEFALGNLARFSRAQLDALHAQFMREVIHPVILPPALDLIAQHRAQGDLLAIITATNHFVTAPIANALGIPHLLAAQPEYRSDGSLTGKLIGAPTSGSGKVSHLQAWLRTLPQQQLDNFPKSYFYSDSQNDIPLLSLVTNPVATNPNTLLSTHAQKLGWPTLQLFKQ